MLIQVQGLPYLQDLMSPFGVQLGILLEAIRRWKDVGKDLFLFLQRGQRLTTRRLLEMPRMK